MKKQKSVTSTCKGSGMYIPAGMFLGLGIGVLFDQAGAGVLIGFGAGFLALALDKRLK